MGLNDDDTLKFINKFKMFMKQFKLNKISCNKYQELSSILDQEKQQDADSAQIVE